MLKFSIAKFGLKKLEASYCGMCKAYFGIWNRLRMTFEFD